MGGNLKGGYLNRYEASMAYKGGLLPSIEYPLGVSTLTEAECNTVMAKVNSAVLNKLGIRCSLNRSLLYGPLQYGALGFNDPFTTAGIEKIKLYIGHQRKNITQRGFKQ